MGKFDDYINVTAPLHSATAKGKLGNANEVFLEGDTQNIENEIKEINSRHEELNKKHDTLNTKHESLSKTVQGISATGKANTATEVTYNNTNSGIVAENIQDAVDKLAAKDATKAEKSDVQSSVSELKDKNTLQDAEIAKKANSADVTSQMQKEQSRVNTELGKKFDKESILQESGEAEDKVMSQKAVNDKIKLAFDLLLNCSSSKNLFNKYDSAYNAQGCFINPNDGKVNFAENCRISHLIWLNTTTNSTITVSSSNSISAAFGYRFFDKDFKIINFGSFDNKSSKILQIPENAVYFQFSYSVKYKNIQVEYGDTVTAYEEYNSEYEQKIEEVKEPLENINTKVSDLSTKTKDISSDNETLGDIDKIDFCDDEDNVVHSIGKDSASFKNLKSNGQNVLTAKDIEGKADKDKSIIVQKESLAAGDEITLEENHIHSCKRIMFTANINSVGTIEVGVGKKEYWASWFEITETNITLKSYLTSEYNPNISFTHGLTLKKNIQFIIDVDDKGNVDLRLTSSGNSYVGHISVDNDATKTIHNWLGVNGKIRATSVSASLSDCSLSFTCDGYYKEIQVYGDSYINVLNERRAYYYLAQNGYNRNIMLNALPGEASKQALADLKLNLKYSAPKRILWAMGMNDLDANKTTPSKYWLDSVNEFLSICKENNIIPILATIPSVVGGYSEDSGIGDKRIHKAKNDWVKSSGYRYVDFAKAVGANDVTGYWFNNGESDDMLESGSMRVHPTKYGAVALYHQLITDFPEILMK